MNIFQQFLANYLVISKKSSTFAAAKAGLEPEQVIQRE